MSKICWPSAGWTSPMKAVRRWVLRFGPLFAKELRRRRHRPTSHWHLDEMAVLIAGRRFWLWRRRRRGSRSAGATATRRDCSGETDAQAAQKHGLAPDVPVTDKLRSYAEAKSELRLTARHEQGRGRSNRAENSHLPVRRRERKDAAVQIGRISATDPIRPCCSPERVQRPTPSRFPQRAPRSQRRSVSALASGDCGLK